MIPASGPFLSGQTPDAAQHLKELAKANSLDAAGTPPWHLRMTFQLYDLYGKPKESGTIEEWWVSPQSRRIEVRSPSYNLTVPRGASDPPDPAKHNRESFLVSQLLDEVVHPVPSYADFDGLRVVEANRTFGKLNFSCISVTQSKGNLSMLTTPGQFCFAPGTTVLRAVLDEGQFAATRNKLAIFRGVELGLDNGITYGNKSAITGHIDALEFFKPNPSVVLSSNTPASPLTIPGTVLAGRIRNKVAPAYPREARENHISGTVVLCATISKLGTITDLDVVASPDGNLSHSAMDAVSGWTYQPFLLNGEPAEVETLITVNYNLTF